MLHTLTSSQTRGHEYNTGLRLGASVHDLAVTSENGAKARQ